MGHKYRKKNRLRAEERRLKRRGTTWSTMPSQLIGESVVDAMRQYWMSSTGVVTVGELGPEVVIPPPDGANG